MSEVEERERAGTRGPLAVRGFQLLAGGQFASTIGDYCYAVALPWLVLSSHGSPALLGTVLACYGVPRMVLLPVGGVLADKFGPRLLMLSADVLRGALVIVMALLAARHTASLAALAPTAALIGAGEGLFLPSSLAIMPRLVAGDQLPAANAVSAAMVQAGSLIGPAVGGALVAATGASTAAFAVDAASFGISALTLAFIRPGPAVQVDDEAPAEEDGGAITYLRRTRAMQVILMVVIAANLASGASSDVALPSLAHASWGAGGYGAVLACFAAGAVLGTLGAARTAGLRYPALFAGLVFVVEAVAICLVPYLGGEAGAAAAMLVTGVTNGLGNTTFLTLAQRQIPPALMGRVISVVMLCAFGTFPLSVAVAGVLVKHIGPAPLFPIAGALVGIAMLAGLASREFREFGSGEPMSL